MEKNGGKHGTVSLRNKHLQKCCLVASTDMTIFMLFILYNTIAMSSVRLPEVFGRSFSFLSRFGSSAVVVFTESRAVSPSKCSVESSPMSSGVVFSVLFEEDVVLR